MAHIRPATPDDLDAMTELLLDGAARREARNPVLWRMHAEARYKVRGAIGAALATEAPAFDQRWLVAETGRGLAGVAHTIRLPVPPIYAGAFGPPGLIVEDSVLAEDAEAGLASDLVAAAEDSLIAQGARILLGSSLPGGPFENVLETRGYAPLTLYLGKTGLSSGGASGVRAAGEDDI